MRKFIRCVIFSLSIVCISLGLLPGLLSVAAAEIKSLPSTLKTSASAVESDHKDGVAVFFRSIEEQNCDGVVIHDSKFFRSTPRPGAIAQFRIESKVEANCMSREIWQCRSVFEGKAENNKFTYKYTDCQTDAPLIED